MRTMRITTLVILGFLAPLSPAAHLDPVSAPDLSAQLGDDGAPLVLDVRTEREYDSGHVPGAVNIPHTELPARLSELSTGRRGEIVVYCEVGGRAAVAEDILEEAGFTRVRSLQGHMRDWRANRHPMQE